MQRNGKEKDKRKWIDKKSGQAWANKKRTSRRGAARVVAGLKQIDVELDWLWSWRVDSVERRLKRTYEECYGGRD